MIACDRFWFLTWTTYGTWLPGDARGSVTSVKDRPGPRHRNNIPGTPTDGDMPGLRGSAEQRLKSPPIGVPGDPDPEILLRDLKSYASRRLNQEWGKPRSDTWWTESGSKRKLKDESAVLATAKYIRDQDFPLAVFLRPEFARELPT